MLSLFHDRIALIVTHFLAGIFTPASAIVNLNNFGDNLINEICGIAAALVGVITATIIAIYWIYRLRIIIVKFRKEKNNTGYNGWNEGT